MNFLLHPLSYSRLRFGFSCALLAGAFLVSWKPAQAATFTVTTTADSGPGSLRQAVLSANASGEADTITFDAKIGGTLTLTGGEIKIKRSLTISGPGMSSLRISGGGTQRLFNISGGKVTLQKITLSDGFVAGNSPVANSSHSGERGTDAGGGCIYNKGTLTLDSVTLSSNSAVGGNGSGGYVTILNPTSESLKGGAGGDARGGAIFNTGTLSLLQTIFTGNKAIGGKGGDGAGWRGAMGMGHGAVGNGGAGGRAYGGAIYNGGIITKGSKTSPSGSTFQGNKSIGGAGGAGGSTRTEMGPLSGAAGAKGTGYSKDIRDEMPNAKDVTLSGEQNRAFSGQLQGQGDNLTYSLTSALPEGLSLDPATGLITGSPTAVTADTVARYRVSDGYRVSPEALIHFIIKPIDSRALVVNTNSDLTSSSDGKNTLREAIAYANSLSVPSTITFTSAVKGLIKLNEGTLVVTSDITIAPPLGQSIVLDGNRTFKVFEIQKGTVSLSNLTITRGAPGGIFNLGTLTLNNCTLSHCTSFGAGGGLHNRGTAALFNCTFTGNKDTGGNGGAIYNSGNLTIDSNTIVGNDAYYQGGGIHNKGTLTLRNSIIANNTSENGPDFYGSVSNGDYNLVKNVAGAQLPGTHNLKGQDPKLGPLQSNGGPTQTMALLSGSPAIDTGNTDLTTDQRGTMRPAGKSDDIGAFEGSATASSQVPIVTVQSPSKNQS